MKGGIRTKLKLKKIVYMVATFIVFTITICLPAILIQILPPDVLNKTLNPNVGFLIFMGYMLLFLSGLSLVDHIDSYMDKM